MSVQKGMEIAWHLEDGVIIIDRSDLSEEDVMAALLQLIPAWMIVGEA